MVVVVYVASDGEELVLGLEPLRVGGNAGEVARALGGDGMADHAEARLVGGLVLGVDAADELLNVASPDVLDLRSEVRVVEGLVDAGEGGASYRGVVAFVARVRVVGGVTGESLVHHVRGGGAMPVGGNKKLAFPLQVGLGVAQVLTEFPFQLVELVVLRPGAECPDGLSCASAAIVVASRAAGPAASSSSSLGVALPLAGMVVGC